MIYTLLDTNILIGLVKNVSHAPALNKLIDYVEDGQLILLVPQTLQNEWTKKKIQTIADVEKTFANSASLSATQTRNTGLTTKLTKQNKK